MNKERNVRIFWGIVLMLAGLGFLLSGRIYLTITDPWAALALNAGLSLAFFASYYLSGVQKWGWLFPACIFVGTSLTALISILAPGAEGGWIAAPVLLSVAVPFLVAYSLDREKRGWALIPVYVIVAISLIPILADQVAGELMGTFILEAIALAFLIVYLRNRTRLWALIPAGILAVIGIIPALTLIVMNEWLGVAIMFLFAAPFFVVYLTGTKRWWALIPAGIFATLGVAVFLVLSIFSGTQDGDPKAAQMVGGVLFLGWGLTFFGLWLLRGSAPTAWAIYPALLLGALALVTSVAGQAGIQAAWPAIMIAGGALLLLRTYRVKAA